MGTGACQAGGREFKSRRPRHQQIRLVISIKWQAFFFEMPYYIYILQSLKDGSYYIGSTQDLEERLERHNQGRSKYTKMKRPWKLVYFEERPDRSAAVIRENEIKRHKRKAQIIKLINQFSSG